MSQLRQILMASFLTSTYQDEKVDFSQQLKFFNQHSLLHATTKSRLTFRSSGDSAASPHIATRNLCRRTPIVRRQYTVNMRVCVHTQGRRASPYLIHSSPRRISSVSEKRVRQSPTHPTFKRGVGGAHPAKSSYKAPGGAGKQPDTPKFAAYTGCLRQCKNYQTEWGFRKFVTLCL